MAKLETEVRQELARIMQGNPADHGDPHHHLCHWAANRFNLWGTDNLFPLWLSRVVEGFINDYREAQAGYDADNDGHLDRQGHVQENS